MLTRLEKLNQVLRDNCQEDFVSPRHCELDMRPLYFGLGTSLWEWGATHEQMLNPFGYVAGGHLTKTFVTG